MVTFVNSVYVTFSWDIHAANTGGPVVFVTVRKLPLGPTAWPGDSKENWIVWPGEESPVERLAAMAGPEEYWVALRALVIFSDGN